MAGGRQLANRRLNDDRIQPGIDGIGIQWRAADGYSRAAMREEEVDGGKR